MTLSTAPFCVFSAFFSSLKDCVVVSWGLIEGLDVARVQVEVDRGSGFTEIADVVATVGRIIDIDGTVTDTYRLIGEAADAELWVPTDSFTPLGTLAPQCEVTGTVIDLQGNPVFNETVRAELLSVEGFSDEGQGVVNNEVTVKTNALGEFKMTLIQGATVRFEIPGADWSRPVVIPEQGSVNFRDLDELFGDFIRNP